MSQFIKFYFTSSMLNMFRTLIHPSSGACDFFLLYHHICCVFLFRCVLEFRCGWVGVVSVWQAEAQLLLFYFTSYVLNMFRTLIYPSSGAYDFFLSYHHIGCVFLFRCVLEFRCGWLGWYLCGRLKPATQIPPQPATPKLQDTSKQEHTTNVVIQ